MKKSLRENLSKKLRTQMRYKRLVVIQHTFLVTDFDAVFLKIDFFNSYPICRQQSCTIQRVMRRTVSVLICLPMFAYLAVAQSSASPSSLYAAADVVFAGRLEQIHTSPNGMTAKFSIDQFIKGKHITAKNTDVELPSSSRCDALKENHAYLVYARNVGSTLWVDPCEGTKLMSMAEDDLRYLHAINPNIRERCNQNRLRELASRSATIAIAEVIATEDSLHTPSGIPFRPWCGLVFTTEDAYYKTVRVLKDDIPHAEFVVEHPICWDTVTVDGYIPQLSPRLFAKGNHLLLFLRPDSHQVGRELPAPFKVVYQSVDENCGAVLADDDAARTLIRDLN